VVFASNKLFLLCIIFGKRGKGMSYENAEIISKTRIFLKNNGVILPKKPIQEFYSQIFKLSGFGIGGVLSFAGKKAGSMAADMIKEMVGNKEISFEEVMGYIITFLSESGVCSPQKWNISDSTIRIAVKNSIFATSLENSKKPVCIPLSSALAGILSELFGEKWEAQEEECQAQGKEYCVFVIKRK